MRWLGFKKCKSLVELHFEILTLTKRLQLQLKIRTLQIALRISIENYLYSRKIILTTKKANIGIENNSFQRSTSTTKNNQKKRMNDHCRIQRKKFAPHLVST